MTCAGRSTEEVDALALASPERPREGVRLEGRELRGAVDGLPPSKGLDRSLVCSPNAGVVAPDV